MQCHHLHEVDGLGLLLVPALGGRNLVPLPPPLPTALVLLRQLLLYLWHPIW